MPSSRFFANKRVPNFRALALLLAGLTIAASAQTPASQPAAKRLERAALEREFEQSLTGVMLKGSWQMTDRSPPATPGPDGSDEKSKQPAVDPITRLTPPQPETYTIESAHKAERDWWVLTARIEAEGFDVSMPVRIRVVWAEDTPILTLDEVTLPGLGTFTARVMIFRGFYCGTWSGGGHAGIMSGRVMKIGQAAAASQPSKASP